MYCRFGRISIFLIETSEYLQSNFEVPGPLRSLSLGLIPTVLSNPCIYYHRLNTNNFKVPLAEHFYVLSRKILCVYPIGVHILAVAQSRIPACAFCTRQARFAQILPMYVT